MIAPKPQKTGLEVPSSDEKTPPPEATWLSTKERGSVLGIRAVVWLATVFGRRPARWLLRAVALYYASLPDVRRASAQWLSRAASPDQPYCGVPWREVPRREVVDHVFHFAQVTLDKLFFLGGKRAGMRFHHHGAEHLQALADSGSGGILLSAHMGNPSAMSAEGHDQRLRINIAGYFKNAAMINTALNRLNPASSARVVHISPGSPSAVLEIRERVEAGEMVAIAGDRVGLNGRTVEVPFFGELAPFPLAPFVLASMLKKPVFFVVALYHEPDRYELYCEPFAASLAVPRKDRQAHLRAHVARYAERLEHYGRRSPKNWFNFYDFWHPNQ